MKYYKDPNNKIYAYEADGSQDDFITDDLMPITSEDTMRLLIPPLADRIANTHARINAAYEIAVNSLTAGYPKTEIDSWAKQENEARAWLANNSTSTPWIDSASTARGLEKGIFISLVIANADALAPLHGALTGKRQSLRDAINALGETPTQEQLDAIQW